MFYKVKLSFKGYPPVTAGESASENTEIVVLKTYGDFKHLDSFVRMSELDPREGGLLPEFP